VRKIPQSTTSHAFVVMFKHAKSCPCDLPIKKQIQIFVPFLKKISKARTFAQKQKLFQEAPKCFTKFISNCSSAILREYIQLPDETWRKLKKHKNLLLHLSDEKKGLKNKIDTFLDKSGGAFPFIPILASILANVALPYIHDRIKNG
jgi:hypothetical protein